MQENWFFIKSRILWTTMRILFISLSYNNRWSLDLKEISYCPEFLFSGSLPRACIGENSQCKPSLHCQQGRTSLWTKLTGLKDTTDCKLIRWTVFSWWNKSCRKNILNKFLIPQREIEEPLCCSFATLLLNWDLHKLTQLSWVPRSWLYWIKLIGPQLLS